MPPLFDSGCKTPRPVFVFFYRLLLTTRIYDYFAVFGVFCIIIAVEFENQFQYDKASFLYLSNSEF